MPALRLGNAIESNDVFEKILKAYCALAKRLQKMTDFVQETKSEILSASVSFATLPLVTAAGMLFAILPEAQRQQAVTYQDKLALE